MEPSTVVAPEPQAHLAELTGKLTDSTRRSFIKGIASAGASTVAAVALDRTGVVDLFGENALATGPPTAFSEFTAIAASDNDALELPPEFRWDPILSYRDKFKNGSGEELIFGYNNDFLAYFPIKGSDEGLLFVNHEYPAPFFQHGYKKLDINPGKHTKSAADIQLEQDSVGNSIVHIKRNKDGIWKVVSPSTCNRRLYGDRPRFDFTGPRKGAPGIGDFANGTVGNCSGGITPWGTALSCEENYDGYGKALSNSDSDTAWAQLGGDPNDAEYEFTNNKKYGWVCEHDPYDPSSTPRKHTALGRFRHENTAFRHVKGKKFVLYMGDDKANEGVYKFVSDREFIPGNRANNKEILESGKLYVARWEPGGRRTFTTAGDVTPTSPTSGTGRWILVGADDPAEPNVADYTAGPSELDDCATNLRKRFGNARFNAVFATNRPEDVEVHRDGSVYVALTNNSTVNDSHGSVRKFVEDDNHPEALTFKWEDYAAGGPTGRPGVGEAGFSSPDNLVFDKSNNLWVVTDISSSRLNKVNEYQYHANNAVFYVPTSGANRGIGFRFANLPREAEGTGPYFTPDEQTLFMSVQHPGEETANQPTAEFGTASTYSSYWPHGNKKTGENPSEPLPTVVAITRRRRRRRKKGDRP